MRRIIALLLLVIVLASPSAYAMDIEDLFGGLTSIIGSDDGVTYGVDETATSNDVSATLNEVMESKGNKHYKPEEGNIYLVCEFTIENNTSESLAISSMMCFSTSCDENTYGLSLEALAQALLVGKTQLDGAIDPGKRMTGVVGYEVPKGWKELKIQFSPDWGGDKLTFVASRE